MNIPKKLSISIIGLGYVGLPLALEFGKKFYTIGFDYNSKRVKQLKNNLDANHEVTNYALKNSKVNFTNNKKDIFASDVYIITVPTSIKKNKKPDFSNLINSTRLVSKSMKKKSIIIYESTVYPGATREICLPIIEKLTKYKLNKDFYIGYSPERINPGDKKHTLTNIKKITSASNQKSLNIVDKLYNTIIPAGTYKAKSIEVAEAAKVIENTQRDINIAFMNEISKFFDKLSIDTNEVLKAAKTKWNFLDFRPGLVGGHCIGIDPFYLSYKFKKINIEPNIILSGRKINDSMPNFVLKKIKNFFKLNKINKNNYKIILLGLSFKEDCNDIRNSKIFNVIELLIANKFKFNISDPLVDKKIIPKKYVKYYINFKKLNISKYNFILIGSPHKEILKINFKFLRKKGIKIFDIKSSLSSEIYDINL